MRRTSKLTEEEHTNLLRMITANVFPFARVIKGQQEKAADRLVLYHVQIYLKGVRSALLSKTKGKGHITKKELNEFFTWLLNE